MRLADDDAPGAAPALALTLDACGGDTDHALLAALVRLQMPATVFVTRRWIDRNPAALATLLARPDLFELQNHGAAHVPALIGQRLYGMQGPADLAGVEREILGGAQAITRVSGQQPRWYRGAGARYDAQSLQLIERLQLRLAGYSLNADDGATASAEAVSQRLRRAVAGDIVLAHLNHPGAGTGPGLARALPDLQQRGFRFVRLSQVAGTRPLTQAPAR
ncbi:MAG: polysaccharide deacetylase family protein [Rubrivivax sp.]|nr:polysaccharide deacetylase family protein [Rubrivivax sp.]